MENTENKKSGGLTKGVIWGVVAGLVILAVVVAIVFFFFKKDNGAPADNTGQTQEQAKLRITVITKKDCADCWDVNLFLDALRDNNIKEEGLETIYIDDASTQNIVDKYKITKIPTVLISGELDKNANLAAAWPSLGEVIDGVFVFREILPPYVDLATGQIKGKFSVTYLTDQSCAECYNYQDHEQVLKNFGMKASESKTVDVSTDEGKALVEKYAIEGAPTIILTGELSEYQYLNQVWPLVGKTADDGAYVFTKLEEMGSYKNIKTGKVVEVSVPTAAETAPAAQ
jgi:hypothetical protein